MARKSNKLLRDAIADAKAVRETALANAKAALEEAFTPHLTSMLSARLKNETDFGDDYDDEELDELNDPVPGDAHGSDDGGTTDIDAVERSSHTGDQNVTEDVTDYVEGDGAKLSSSGIATEPTQKYGSSNPKQPAGGQDESSDVDNEGLQQPAGSRVSEGLYEDEEEEDAMGLDGEEDDDFPMEGHHGPSEGNDEWDEDEEDRDMDLEAIIAELESDVEGDEGEDEMDDDEFPVEGHHGPSEGHHGPSEGHDDYTDDEDPIDDEDSMMEANDNTPSAADGHGADEGGETDRSANMDSTFTQGSGDSQTDSITEDHGTEDWDDDEEDIDLEEILREIEDEEAEDEMDGEITSLRSELKEYRDAVKYLRSKLNEVNLLNAKLLFTNKLFKNYNMDMKQKIRVVENFDRATSVREAKLVFTTLAEAFRGKPVRKRTITEGLASRTVGSTKSRRRVKPKAEFGGQTVLAEGAELAARFQKLAGIITD